MTTSVKNLKFADYEIYIGRPSIFGNPYRSGSRDENCDHYEEYFQSRIQNDSGFKRQVLTLKDKRLGCFCKPERCHGDTIVAYLEGEKSFE
ncbi:MAG TPA: DUF4326 domain-containing protein [bacterium]|nr:DUF4326 domain-containing protein [bacterium]